MYKKGFTMIELLVAIGIFGIFLVIVSGVFSRFMLVERHGIAEGQLISDLRSGMESFIKEARTGYGSTYQVSGSVTNNEAVFRNQSGYCVAYRVSTSGVFERGEVAAVGTDCTVNLFTNTSFSPLTGSQTKISEIHFNTVLPTVAGGKLIRQGVMTVSITASSTVSDILPIQLQNTVTSRQMSVYAQ
jgi:prepilin-type N-terminal cleavage/methylation domain-containing protein